LRLGEERDAKAFPTKLGSGAHISLLDEEGALLMRRRAGMWSVLQDMCMPCGRKGQDSDSGALRSSRVLSVNRRGDLG
jgi:hypothetical protein